MEKLSKNTRLQRVPSLNIQLFSDNSCHLEWEGKGLTYGPHVITVLGLFATPITFQDALEQLQVKSRTNWIEITGTIYSLYNAGVLFDVDQAGKNIKSDLIWGNPQIHISLLNDLRRTKSFQKAIAEVIRPGDVVVEIGTASGILAITAAKAGAARIYAIEANAGIARVAQENFAKNNLSDRIQLITGWSTEVDLPEKADVLITDLIGHNPFSENVWEITTDAIKRFLKPNARLMPNILRIFGLAVNIPDSDFSRYIILPSTIANWNQQYQIDLSAIVNLAPDPEILRFWFRPQKMNVWKRLSDPVLLAEIDFRNQEQVQINSIKSACIKQDGIANGIVGFFEIQLSPETRHSTSPSETDNNNFWLCPVWIPNEPFAVTKGDLFSIQYKVEVSSTTTRLKTWLGTEGMIGPETDQNPSSDQA